MKDPDIASILIPGALVFLVLALLTLRFARALENRLILLGLLTAVLGLLDGWLGGIHVGGGPTTANVSLGLSGAAATMMKIAFLLVLGGVIVAVFGRGEVVAAAGAPQEAPHV